jgi:hypothetical protein
LTRRFEEKKELRHMSSSTSNDESIDGNAKAGRMIVGKSMCYSRRGWRLAAVVCAVLGLTLVWVNDASAAVPKVEEEWVADVSATAATLVAKVNPDEVATTYRFEYATSEASLLAGEGEVSPTPPAPEGEVGAGGTGVTVEVHLQGLQPHTNYWYRVNTKSAEGAMSGCQTQGACHTLTTQPAGEEPELPDARAWELVSPAVKDGALIVPMGEGGGLLQAAEDGDAITYLSVGPAKSVQGEEPAGNSNETQVLSVRHADGGWFSQDIATPHEVSTGVSVGQGQEYRWFSPNLSVALVEPFGSGEAGTEAAGAAPLSPGASEKTIYLHADAPLSPEAGSLEQAVYSEAHTEGGYLPVVTGCPPEDEECMPTVEARANTLPGAKFGGELKFDGATGDLSHVVLSSDVPLTAKAEGLQLYEWTVGAPPKDQLQIVSVLPNVPPYNGAEVSHGPGFGSAARGAISSNGSRIIWSYEKHLFMRDTSNGQTAQLDAVQGGSGGPSEIGARLQFANSDGSEAFFTDEEQLTANSKAEIDKPDLYECEITEVDSQSSCRLSDLTADVNLGQDADVQGVVLSGSDTSSYFYFVAKGELTDTANERGEKARAGADNLYLLHSGDDGTEWGKPVFIATLSEADMPDWGGDGRDPDNLEEVTSRVSSDGTHLAFMSEQSLTGYDNADANSGVADEEVYVYSAPTAAVPDGRLVCVSCNSTGVRPHGTMDVKGALFDKQKNWEVLGEEEGRSRWLAAAIPGWTAMDPPAANYQSRYLSDSGRVFFDSSDALVPQATNGLMDVYEYEPVGVGSCTSSSGTYSERSDGCVGLISSGSSSEESVFIDASESGGDVFFLTSAPLVPKDEDTAFDVYDAHVCSSAAPCSSEAVSSPPCTTADSCRAAPTPQSSIFGAPSSATFAGAGNLTPVSTPEVKQVKSTNRAQKLGEALKVCRAKKNKHKRIDCESRARKKYDPADQAKHSRKEGK